MEVVLAVGVVAFAFVAILGMLPAGMTQYRQAIDTSVCAQIGQRCIMDALQSDFEVLTDKDGVPKDGDGFPKEFYTFRAPKVNTPSFRYFDEQGNEIVFTTASPSASELTKKQVIYHVNTRIGVTTSIPAKGYTGPANSDVATVTVEVAFNPANSKLDVNTGGASDKDVTRRNLLVLRPGLAVRTFGAQVGRNQ